MRRLEIAPQPVGCASEPAQIFGHELVLGGEMAIQGHLVGAGRFRDGFDAHGTNPVLVKELAGGRQYALARRFLCCFFSTYGHGPDGPLASP
jgi:hypothetical protein